MSSSLAFLRLFAAALSAAWTALPPKALVSVAALPAAALALLTAPVAMVPAQHAAFGRHLNGLPGCHVSLPVAMPTGTVASGSGRRSSAVGQQPERDGEHVLSGALGEHTCTVARRGGTLSSGRHRRTEHDKSGTVRGELQWTTGTGGASSSGHTAECRHKSRA